MYATDNEKKDDKTEASNKWLEIKKLERGK